MAVKFNVNGGRPGCIFCRREVDQKAIGLDLMEQRNRRGVARAELARAMEVTPQYICDLELGRRNWTPRTIERYLAAMNGIK